jgi:hypothetical protein
MSTKNLSLDKVVEILSEYYPDTKQDMLLTLNHKELFNYIGDIEHRSMYIFGCKSFHVDPHYFVSFVCVFKDSTNVIVADYYHLAKNVSFETLDQLRQYITNHPKVNM